MFEQMSLPQAVVFWLMLGAMLSTFADIEKAWNTPSADLQPVNRRLIDMMLRQL